jgi:2-polyprenyl-3-methyl-5-hydroxy-6-metoxy-1,4-benzoquinol methylase
MSYVACVESLYDSSPQREWERLERHRTEFAVSLRALQDYLPPPPAQIVDIGGGPGRYAIALTQQGYTVTLVDLSRANLALARQKAKEAGVALQDYIHANALELGMLAAEWFDAALVFGPLYHLLDECERRQAVCQAFAKLKPGGALFAAFIGRYAPARNAAKEDPAWIIEERASHEMILRSGQYRGTGFPAYFAHPAEIQPFMESFGLRTLGLLACEGVISMIEDKVNALDDEAWTAWVELNYQLGKDPSVHGIAEHLLYIGEKTA